ncbi:zf-HC2 domain-containing protein [Pseudidiomarina homiensis]|uniref:zf-HC2 domain-containing protein n=1 Tax=Pseudidiomarina homiensis TaxID=364198 RepID=UPI00215A6227|nr:zf-HC2 domain-containing protein [Pseudidiomarina homiensis]
MTQQEQPCQNIEPLISGALDNELTQQQRQQLHLHLASCEDCANLYRELAEQRGAVKLGVQTNDVLNESQSTRIWNAIGWSLLVLGLIPLVIYAIYQFSQDTSIPWWIKLTIGTTVLGLILLFINVLRQRMQAAKSDPYKKVNL